MNSKEITLWINERWYQALSERLNGSTLEEYLQGVLDQMCRQLPEYESINRMIQVEEEQARLEREAAMRFAVFRVTEDKASSYFLVRENVDMIHAATRLRLFIRMRPESPDTQYKEFFNRVEPLTQKQFQGFVSERRRNTGRVTGAFHVNFDRGTFDTLHPTEGWYRFYIRDVTTTAYFAMKRSYARWDERWAVFEDRLDGKELPCDEEEETAEEDPAPTLQI